MAYFLPAEVDLFPHPLEADEDGLLAIGSHLSPQTLLLAYQHGIFPWTSEDEPLLWFFTHPRCILYPEKVRVSKSMRSYLNLPKFDWTIDTCFKDVIEQCKLIPREGQEGTWLFPELQNNMIALHEMGYAHSVEVWSDGDLVGGLYGLAIGKVFYGESMFAHKSNASKFALIKLAHWLKEREFWLIDCQQETTHIMRMGAELINGKDFYTLMKKNIFAPSLMGPWKK